MKKTAIFVEGHTELIFVREYLLKMFEYQNIDLECYNLHNRKEHSADYAFPNKQATHHFRIVNVGNDETVLSYILESETYIWNKDYHKIVALRDMFSKNYIKVNGRNIDHEINMQFINDAKEQIEKKAQKPKKIHFCFAIMEMEAWFLGFSDLFIKIDARLTNTFIKEKLDFDLDNIDPETDPEFFHPAKKLNDIYELIGKKYEKPESAKPILGHLEKFDFEYFYEIDKCNSFKIFHKTLIISNL